MSVAPIKTGYFDSVATSIGPIDSSTDRIDNQPIGILQTIPNDLMHMKTIWTGTHDDILNGVRPKDVARLPIDIESHRI